MLKIKDVLTINELTQNELLEIIDLGIKLKKENGINKNKAYLKNKTLAMIFQKPSTRTRISFEIGMFQLGGYALNLSHNDLQLSRGESIEDTAKTISIYVDVIMARMYEHEKIEILAKNSSVPVVNGLSNLFHPCQTLADLMTIKEHKNTFDGLKIAWVGDCTNVCNSLIYGCSKLGINISIATPRGYEPNHKIVDESKKHVLIEIDNDPLNIIENSDVVMTDTFISIHDSNDIQEKTKKFLPKFRINSTLMKKAKKNAIFLHCLPAKRGHEVTKSVIDGKQSVIWDEVENRLHVQKALLLSLNI